MVTVTRYLFIVINTFHIVLGILLTMFGFWLQYASPIREVLNSDTTSLSVIYFAITMGFILLAFGACGAFGNVATNKRILGAYLGINVVVVILEIAIIAYGYSQRNSLQTHVQSVWFIMPLIDQYVIQARFNCCGFTGPSEYNNVYPDSCLQNATASTTNAWPVGCYLLLTYWFDQNVYVLAVMIGLLLVASILQVILCSKLLWNVIRNPNAVAVEQEFDIEDEDENRKSPSRSGSRVSRRSYQHLT